MTSETGLQARIAKLEAELSKAQETEKISRALNAAQSEDELLQAIVQPAIDAGAFSASLAYADLGESGGLEWLEIVAVWKHEGAPVSEPGTRFYVPEFPFSNLWLSDPERSQLIDDIENDERLDENTRNLLRRVGTKATAIIPLAQAGRWVGLVVITWNTPHTFGEIEAEIYHAIPALASAAIENRRLIVEKQQVVVDKLYELSRRLSAARDLDELFETLIEPGKQAGAMAAMLFYIDLNEAGEPEWIETVATWHKAGIDMGTGARLLLKDFPLCDLFLTDPDNPVMVSDAFDDERVDENSREAVNRMRLRSLVIIPLTQAGRWVGALDFFWGDVHDFSDQEAEIYSAMSGLAASAVENRRLVDQLEQMVDARTAALRESEGRLRAIVSNVPLIIFLTNEDGALTLIEGKGLEIAGLELDELIEVSVFDLYAGEAAEALRRTLQEGEPASFVAKMGDGFFDYWTNPTRDTEGNITGMIGVAFDITERRQVEEERTKLQQEIIDAQRATLRELSTPIIPVMEGIIVMPMVGDIDTNRARETTRALLMGITEYRAKVVILDITGVPMIDSVVAGHLNKTIQAARLKGTRSIITGVSDAVAETMVEMGIDWSTVETLRDLQTGLAKAIHDLGVRLDRTVG